jgi:transcriptional regulator with XRE-family HTH domain
MGGNMPTRKYDRMAKDTVDIFRQRLGEEMERQGISQPKLAQKVGVAGHADISKILGGHTENPGMFYAARYAAALGIELWQLLVPQAIANGLVAGEDRDVSLTTEEIHSAMVDAAEAKKRRQARRRQRR